jgi:hypothetical protein
MPSINSRRRAPFGGGAPQAADQACRSAAIGRPGRVPIRAPNGWEGGGAASAPPVSPELGIDQTAGTR